jgi:hypothetical protein
MGDGDGMKRLCGYGPCDKSLDGKREHAIYCSSYCRMRAWKTRKKITGIRYVKASQNGSQRKPEQPRVRYDLAVEAAREAHEGRDPEECVLERLTDAQHRQREQLERRAA